MLPPTRDAVSMPPQAAVMALLSSLLPAPAQALTPRSRCVGAEPGCLPARPVGCACLGDFVPCGSRGSSSLPPAHRASDEALRHAGASPHEGRRHREGGPYQVWDHGSTERGADGTQHKVVRSQELSAGDEVSWKGGGIGVE